MAHPAVSAPTASTGWLNGLLGVIIFSGSLPATRLAIGSFEPLWLTCARATLAALLGAVLLWRWRQPWPSAPQWRALATVALGVVLGFPLLSAMALQHLSASHSIVWVGLLPLATAGFAVLRGERPKPAFWLFSFGGSAVVVSYAVSQGARDAALGDGLMLLAVVVCGLGYAEGARLSRSLGGWQVICWALLLALPLMLALTLWQWPAQITQAPASAWWALGYVSLFSMLLGFVFWYRGLAQGGIAAVGQLQLLQPFFGLALAALLLGEAVGPGMLLVTLAVVACVALARRYAH